VVPSKPQGRNLRIVRAQDDSGKSQDPAPVSMRKLEPPEVPSTSGSGPSASGSNGGAGNSNSPFHRLLSKLPKWPAQLFGVIATGQIDGKTADPRVLRILRLSCLFTIFAGVVLTREAMLARTRPVTQEVMYSSFVKLLDSNRVRAARLESGTGKMYFDLKPQEAAQPAASPSGTAQAATTATASAATHVRFQKQFVVKLADKADQVLVSRVLAHGVEFAVLKQSFSAALANVFMTALALWIPLMPLIFLLRRIMEERSGTSRKKKADDGKARAVSITFNDVAGVDSAKEELMEVVSVMKAQKAAYSKLKVKMPSGVLLCGPPGTGKTLLAKAVAGEAGIPFLACSASEFVELFVGRGAARIRELFAEARKNAPCVVFIDELDAVGARRGMGYNDERDQTLNQLLTELDGFEGRQGVLFLAATNRIDVLDPALLRPGRINRKVVVPLPDESGRRDILGVHLRSVPMESMDEKAEACDRMARVTSGFSGAELANVVNEAALLAARKDQDVVTLRELIEGVSRTKYGVNGQMKKPNKLQEWLMDLATSRPNDPRVKNATA